ncbi:MAG: hypothetical protein ACFCUN_01785 [Hyphomicrobiaceae bacterium]
MRLTSLALVAFIATPASVLDVRPDAQYAPSFCARNPQTCAALGEVLAAASLKARLVAERALDVVALSTELSAQSKRQDQPAPSGFFSEENHSRTDGRAIHHGTLTARDRNVEWTAPGSDRAH